MTQHNDTTEPVNSPEYKEMDTFLNEYFAGSTEDMRTGKVWFRRGLEQRIQDIVKSELSNLEAERLRATISVLQGLDHDHRHHKANLPKLVVELIADYKAELAKLETGK